MIFSAQRQEAFSRSQERFPSPCSAHCLQIRFDRDPDLALASSRFVGSKPPVKIVCPFPRNFPVYEV
jgi:hypothetical protein